MIIINRVKFVSDNGVTYGYTISDVSCNDYCDLYSVEEYDSWVHPKTLLNEVAEVYPAYFFNYQGEILINGERYENTETNS